MKIKKVLALGCALAMLNGYAHAQNNVIVVTATRTQANILNTPSQVNVITQKQIKKEGVLFAKGALKYVPGISIVSNGAFGGTTTVFIRGLSSRYVKTLMDGVDVSDPTLIRPYYDFADLLPDDINRIEIVQGAQSGLYGANAVGGVINIITKRGKGKPHFTLSEQAGSYSTFKESAEAGGVLNRLSFYINALRLDTDGISKMDKYNPGDHSYSKGDEDDSYHQTALSTRLEYELGSLSKLGLVLKWYKTRNYLDNGWYVTPDYHYYPDDSAPSNNTPTAKSLRVIKHFLLSKLYLSKQFGNFKLNLNTFYTQTFRYFKSAPGWNDYKGRRWGSNIQMTYKINKTKITAGVSGKMDKYEDSSPFKKLRYNYAGFLELLQRIENLKLQATAREDDFKTFGKHFTYRLGANYLLEKTHTILKANFGTGFRAPSIYELYAPPIPSWYFLGGNRDLDPEKAKSWDFGFIQLMPHDITISFTYFKNIIKDRIVYYTDYTTWQSTYKNAKGKTVTDGFELGFKAKATKFLTVGANYTYTASKDPETGMQAARVPLRTYTGFVTLSALNKKLNATLTGRYIGKRYDDRKHLHQTGKYAVFDFTANYKINRNLSTSLTIKNIFDRFHEEIYGYSTLPRSVFATVSYRFF